jgi:hypothetical protein
MTIFVLVLSRCDGRQELGNLLLDYFPHLQGIHARVVVDGQISESRHLAPFQFRELSLGFC